MGFWDLIGSKIGTLLLVLTTVERIIPSQPLFTIERLFQKLLNFLNPYIEITFDEFPSESYGRSKAYAAIQTYLGTNFSVRADRIKARLSDDSRSLAFTMADYQEISDVYNGVHVSWIMSKSVPRSNVISFKVSVEEKRAYVRRKDRDVIMGDYLRHVLNEGKAMRKRSRRQRLYTNVSGDEKMMWQCVGFEHPATFETLAMDPVKKKEMMDDMVEFTNAKEYYKRVGKPWKRGYLLYGPGKSTMIAAMANFLHYDVYDLEEKISQYIP